MSSPAFSSSKTDKLARDLAEFSEAFPSPSNQCRGQYETLISSARDMEEGSELLTTGFKIACESDIDSLNEIGSHSGDYIVRANFKSGETVSWKPANSVYLETKGEEELHADLISHHWTKNLISKRFGYTDLKTEVDWKMCDEHSQVLENLYKKYINVYFRYHLLTPAVRIWIDRIAMKWTDRKDYLECLRALPCLRFRTDRGDNRGLNFINNFDDLVNVESKMEEVAKVILMDLDAMSSEVAFCLTSAVVCFMSAQFGPAKATGGEVNTTHSFNHFSAVPLLHPTNVYKPAQERDLLRVVANYSIMCSRLDIGGGKAVPMYRGDDGTTMVMETVLKNLKLSKRANQRYRSAANDHRIEFTKDELIYLAKYETLEEWIADVSKARSIVCRKLRNDKIPVRLYHGAVSMRQASALLTIIIKRQDMPTVYVMPSAIIVNLRPWNGNVVELEPDCFSRSMDTCRQRRGIPPARIANSCRSEVMMGVVSKLFPCLWSTLGPDVMLVMNASMDSLRQLDPASDLDIQLAGKWKDTCEALSHLMTGTLTEERKREIKTQWMAKVRLVKSNVRAFLDLPKMERAAVGTSLSSWKNIQFYSRPFAYFHVRQTLRGLGEPRFLMNTNVGLLINSDPAHEFIKKALSPETNTVNIQPSPSLNLKLTMEMLSSCLLSLKQGVLLPGIQEWKEKGFSAVAILHMQALIYLAKSRYRRKWKSVGEVAADLS